MEQAVLDWLLNGDPAIRWQVKRALLDAPESQLHAERSRVATEGWGAALLSRQDGDGSWGGGLYNPKWISTFYTLLTLAAFGLPSHPQAVRGSQLLLEKGLGPDGGLDYSRPRRAASELCITGMGLRIMSTFLGPEERLAPLVRCLLETQLPDGGWNCQRASAHGSFNTSVSALEGLRGWSAATGGTDEVEAAAERGREFFLAHRMFRSHRTGQVAKEQFTRFSFPYHWHYDVLRGLDYFQSVHAPRDGRLEDAIDLVKRRRRKDGSWPRQNRYPGQEYFEMEPVGRPSRWNTLRALRVLRWWEAPTASASGRSERLAAQASEA